MIALHETQKTAFKLLDVAGNGENFSSASPKHFPKWDSKPPLSKTEWKKKPLDFYFTVHSHAVGKKASPLAAEKCIKWRLCLGPVPATQAQNYLLSPNFHSMI